MTVSFLDWAIVALSLVASFIPALVIARRAGSSTAAWGSAS